MIAFLIVSAAALAQNATQLPDELAHLATLTGEQEDLVAAVRRFHLQQFDLIEWDRTLLTEYSREGKDDLAATKVMDLRRRLGLVQQAWLYVLSYYPNSALANNYYGEMLYDHLDDRAGGVQKWLLAARLDDELGLPHNNLALHYVHSGQIDTGLRHLGTALKLEPKNPDFLYNGAQLYLNFFPHLEKKFEFKKEKLYKEAMRMSREAAKYAPDDFQIVQDYAVNFFASENFDVEPDWKDAAEAWQRAAPLARTEEERFYCLLNEARAWKRDGQNNKALAPLTRALEMRPGSEVAKNLLESINPAAASNQPNTD